MPQRWRVPDRFILLWKCWGDESIVFNPSSGHTHLLNSLAAEALRALQNEPADALELMERICAGQPDTTFRDLSARLDKLFREFDEVGLVEPLTGASP